MPPKGYQSLGEELVTIATRLPASMVQAVDEHIQVLHALAPWARVNRADALRDLVARGLAVTAQEKAAGMPPPEARLSAQYQMSEDTRNNGGEKAPSVGPVSMGNAPTTPDPIAQLSQDQEAEEAALAPTPLQQVALAAVPPAVVEEAAAVPVPELENSVDLADKTDREAQRRERLRRHAANYRARKRASRTGV
jgi:hypothetical protein